MRQTLQIHLESRSVYPSGSSKRLAILTWAAFLIMRERAVFSYRADQPRYFSESSRLAFMESGGIYVTGRSHKLRPMFGHDEEKKMRVPLQITFRDIPPSEAIETAIRDKAMKLERYFDRITSMRVTISAPHKSHQKGNLYDVNIDITVPGQEIVVSHDKHDQHSHEDFYVTLRDAFAAAQRQLEGYVGKMRGEVKAHEVPAHAATPA